MSAHCPELSIIPTSAGVGAEVRGVDLSLPLDHRVLIKIEHALDVHGMIFLRGQHISPRQQIDFSRHFGELVINFNSEDFGLKGTPEIFVISNIVENGRALGVKRVGETWHSDMCYTANPPRATMLYALEVPVLHGLTLGDTAFANTAAAWDALPGSLKSKLNARHAVFDFQGRERARPISDEVAARYPPVTHPIVRTHPSTGRQSLYVMRGDCTGIVGMDNAEAQALINALADHILRPEFIYRHQWRAGDVLIWDNCTVQHRAIIDYDLPQRRLMHRTTMLGTTAP